ncbi:uncharacterized protein [Oryza sativa Japonica Group]|uniref:Os04g0454900 protein n=2 Tax=Oryza sativa subsp. japonica TaxID=39947 RepID=A0A0P0WB18_ORYSJ|nr:uncharacterized protein LOC4336019 isoform X2 [Oryza sativa Japonica Group]KAB8095571.1 hypothetical protein EE612_023692 [Oryza sativa]BAF14875.1 Os04g0454900 [Oryza sativa Japonica Group]BAS89494.1 Os04g0454900 [Oryza sativa Japonica Group]|eukprot:NP_001052961.1 Os04g0454900 [Oryza sativa Japonica Group]
MGRSRPSPPPPHASEARDIDSKSIGPSSNGSDDEKVNWKALKDVIYKECFIHSGLKILSILSDVRLHPHERWNICQKVGSRAAILQNLVNPIEVFVDDECAGKPAPQVPKSSKPSIMKLRQATSRNLKREIELLMENPQRNFPLTNFCLDPSKLIKSSTMVSPVIYAQRRLSYLMNGMGRQQALGDAMQAWRRPTTFNFLDAALPSLGMEIESEEAIEGASNFQLELKRRGMFSSALLYARRRLPSESQLPCSSPSLMHQASVRNKGCLFSGSALQKNFHLWIARGLRLLR